MEEFQAKVIFVDPLHEPNSFVVLSTNENSYESYSFNLPKRILKDVKVGDVIKITVEKVNV